MGTTKMQMNNPAATPSPRASAGPTPSPVLNGGSPIPSSGTLICRVPQGFHTPVAVNLTHVTLAPLGAVGADAERTVVRSLPIWVLPILQMNPRSLEDMIDEMQSRRLDESYIYYLDEGQELCNRLVARTDIKLGRGGLPRFLDHALPHHLKDVKGILTNLELLGVHTHEHCRHMVELRGCTTEHKLPRRYTEKVGRALAVANGGHFAQALMGEPLCGSFLVTDSFGKPIPFVRVTITMPYPQALVHPRGQKHDNPALRKCVIEADENGRFCFQGVRPERHTRSPMGVVGLVRDNYYHTNDECPGTLLFKFHKGREELLTTALFIKDEKDDYKDSDPLEERMLWVDLRNLSKGTAADCGIDQQKGCWEIYYQFSIGTKQDRERVLTQNRVDFLNELSLPILEKDALQMLKRSAPVPPDFD